MTDDFTTWTRRELLKSLAATPFAVSIPVAAAAQGATSGQSLQYGAGTMPAGIRSRLAGNVNGITMHVLEAGFETPGRPACCSCTAFPSWRTAGAR